MERAFIWVGGGRRIERRQLHPVRPLHRPEPDVEDPVSAFLNKPKVSPTDSVYQKLGEDLEIKIWRKSQHHRRYFCPSGGFIGGNKTKFYIF